MCIKTYVFVCWKVCAILLHRLCSHIFTLGRRAGAAFRSRVMWKNNTNFVTFTYDPLSKLQCRTWLLLLAKGECGWVKQWTESFTESFKGLHPLRSLQNLADCLFEVFFRLGSLGTVKEFCQLQMTDFKFQGGCWESVRQTGEPFGWALLTLSTFRLSQNHVSDLREKRI